MHNWTIQIIKNGNVHQILYFRTKREAVKFAKELCQINPFYSWRVI